MSNINGHSFTFNGSKAQKVSFMLLGGGLLLAIVGAVFNLNDLTQIWTGLLFNAVFFVLVGLVAAFFIASQTIGYNGWYTMIKRIPEAMMLYVPIGGLILLAILVFGNHYIYEWTHEEIVANDRLLQGKAPYLNLPFFLGRAVVYVVLWTAFIFLLRRNSLKSDQIGYDLKHYQRSKYISAGFIVIYAVTSSTCSWDWLMSIQPHWYSTLFGWYCFVSVFVTCMSFTMLIMAYLKSIGKLPYVTMEHFHDVGKFMFAFSVAWAYLFYSQYMLIWYANIPEETAYYMTRITDYPLIMWLLVFCNFVVPFLVLMTRDAKRTLQVASIAACIIIFGHWLDFYQMSVPAAVYSANHGHVEHGSMHSITIWMYYFGLFFAFGGLFLTIFFNRLAAVPLVQENHPFVKESKYFHT